MGGTKDYCTENCKAINGGTVAKNVFMWFWVRSSLPKRLWKKCMDYQVKRNDGKLISYKLIGHNVAPVEVKMFEDADFINVWIVKYILLFVYSRGAVVKTPHFSMMG